MESAGDLVSGLGLFNIQCQHAIRVGDFDTELRMAGAVNVLLEKLVEISPAGLFHGLLKISGMHHAFTMGFQIRTSPSEECFFARFARKVWSTNAPFSYR